MVGVQVIAADSDAEAQRLFTTPQQRFLRLIRNQPVELLPPVDSMDGLWTEWERAAVESKLRSAIVGSTATVKASLERLVAATGADEVIVVTDTWDHSARLESYRRLAEVAGMASRRKHRKVHRQGEHRGPIPCSSSNSQSPGRESGRSLKPATSYRDAGLLPPAEDMLRASVFGRTE